MTKKTLDELRRDLAAETNPAALHRMTAAQLAELAGPTPTAAAANALHLARDFPATVLFVSAAAIRPDLLPAVAQPLVQGPPAGPPPPAAPFRTMAAPPPAPPPLANLDSLADDAPQ